jgi:hypothetical protein
VAAQAKLHAAISFLAAIALGVAAPVCLVVRPVTDRFAMSMGAYPGGAFWISLIGRTLARHVVLLAGDPVYANSVDDARTLGAPDRRRAPH